MKKVLIVEDSHGYYSRYRSDLEDLTSEVQMLLAWKISQAWELFSQNSDLDVIIVDACMHSQEPDTMPLVKKIREAGYKGHIVANSNSSKNNKVLLEAGCNLEFAGDKTEMVDQLLKLIGVAKPTRGRR